MTLARKRIMINLETGGREREGTIHYKDFKRIK